MKMSAFQGSKAVQIHGRAMNGLPPAMNTYQGDGTCGQVLPACKYAGTSAWHVTLQLFHLFLVAM